MSFGLAPGRHYSRLVIAAVLAIVAICSSYCEGFNSVNIPLALSSRLSTTAASDNNNARLTRQQQRTSSSSSSSTSTTALMMGLDLVTYLRTEWVSAALVTNQTPRSADVCLQLGCQDGRAVTFIPRTIRELITSSLEPDGVLSISTRRQLKQQQERRQGAAKITYVDQRADDLKEVPDNSVDVVISLQAAAKMVENGLDWKRSMREAARVLKTGGRFLFVEQTTLQGDSYLEYIASVKLPRDNDKNGEAATSDNDDEEEDDDRVPLFELVGYDDVDLVLEPHVAGVLIKSEDAGLTQEELTRRESRAEKERIADLSISAYERGLKKRKRKKKPNTAEGKAESA